MLTNLEIPKQYMFRYSSRKNRNVLIEVYIGKLEDKIDVQFWVQPCTGSGIKHIFDGYSTSDPEACTEEYIKSYLEEHIKSRSLDTDILLFKDGLDTLINYEYDKLENTDRTSVLLIYDAIYRNNKL